jgi:hypothetical protein
VSTLVRSSGTSLLRIHALAKQASLYHRQTRTRVGRHTHKQIASHETHAYTVYVKHYTRTYTCIYTHTYKTTQTTNTHTHNHSLTHSLTNTHTFTRHVASAVGILLAGIVWVLDQSAHLLRVRTGSTTLNLLVGNGHFVGQQAVGVGGAVRTQKVLHTLAFVTRQSKRAATESRENETGGEENTLQK